MGLKYKNQKVQINNCQNSQNMMKISKKTNQTSVEAFQMPEDHNENLLEEGTDEIEQPLEYSQGIQVSEQQLEHEGTQQMLNMKDNFQQLYKEALMKNEKMKERFKSLQLQCLELQKQNNYLKNQFKNMTYVTEKQYQQQKKQNYLCKMELLSLKEILVVSVNQTQQILKYFNELFEKYNTKSQTLTKKIKSLTKNIDDLNLEVVKFNRKDFDQQNYIKNLQKQTNELRQQISQLKEESSFNPNSRISKIWNKGQIEFNQKIHKQLSDMVEQLMRQLNYQKKQHKKNITELKNIAQAYNEAQKQLKIKNNKIYQLQMKIVQIKKSSNYKNQTKRSLILNEENKINSEYYEDNPKMTFHAQGISPSTLTFMKNNEQAFRNNSKLIKQNQQNDYNLNETNFSLKSLIDGKVQLKESQKWGIIARILQLYAKKILNDNFETISVNSIEFINFDSQNSKLLRIRNKKNNENKYRNQTEQTLLENMSQIVQLILKKVEAIKDCEKFELNIKAAAKKLISFAIKEEKQRYFMQIINALDNVAK